MYYQGRKILILFCQAREAELEQTTQELNAALVESRKGGSVAGWMSSHGVGSNNDCVKSDQRVKVLQMELESANSQLVLERERVRKLISYAHQSLFSQFLHFVKDRDITDAA
jgi:hypothetical protein